MNIIDVFFIFILLFNIYSGFRQGFITGMLQLLAMVASFVSAFLLYPHIASFLDRIAPSLGIWRVPFSFIIALLITRVAFSLIINRLLNTTPNSIHENTVNRVMGIVPGAINGIIWVTVISILLLLAPFSGKISSLSQDSKVASIMSDKVSWANEKLSPFLDEIATKPIVELQRDAESEKSVSLPFKDEDSEVREDLEAKMLVLVNEERQKAGLKPLKADPEMRVIAREHSKDMWARGYFSHETPEGLSPFDRMKKAKLRYLAAGENLAIGPTLSICHRGLMNSPGHRKNILSPMFGRVGIGILDGGIHGLMITQSFRN